MVPHVSCDKKAGNRLVVLFFNMYKYNKAPTENSDHGNKTRQVSVSDRQMLVRKLDQRVPSCSK